MSKRLIDANELISAMYYYEHNDGGLTAYDAQDIINKSPSIDIVFCKDCKFYDKLPTWSACTYWSGDPYEQASVNDNDFCSYGEREGE